MTIARVTVCGVTLKTVMGTCERGGRAEYGGRCHQHRRPTATDAERAKEQRIADRRALDRRLDIREAEGRLLRAALEHGLHAPETATALDALRELVTT